MIERILKWLGLRGEEVPSIAVEEPVIKKKKRVVKKKPAKKRATRTVTKRKGTKKDALLKALSRRKKPAKIEDLAKAAGVTPMTARRYLYYLAKEGKVKKTKEGWLVK